MRTILTGLCLLLLSAPSYADDSSDSFEDSFKVYCEAIASAAEATMNMRQAGVSITDAMNLHLRPEFRVNSEVMIRATSDAYSHSIYLTDEYKYKAARELGTRYYLKCINNPSALTNP